MTSSHVLRFPLEDMTGVTIRCKSCGALRTYPLDGKQESAIVHKCHHCGEAFDKALEFFLFKLQTALRESRETEKASIEFELEQ